ncbi:hypothetical protein B1729_08270 [Microbacterium sp. B35-04]|uniref:hypothetical protein n=1 Tax=unclassified Microbacterium TaxID=2609290 RepID=UPI0013D62EB9|nr:MULTISPECIES: hypothetical protein [unclassified Microbacterium]KAF2413731.1 hypothetical protein B1729_08270 [Microbacterium sp. B35-04]KAF2416587.1 hypothetical protein B2K11_15330 [Microbacterium sp. B35-30]
MGVLSRFRRRRGPYRAATEEERISRYVYLLGTLPASVIESAHASAFKDLPPERRRELFEQLRPFLAESERDVAAEDPSVIAKLVRRAEEHRAARAADAGTDAAARAAADPARTAVAVDDGDPRDGVDVQRMLLNVGVMTIVAQQFLLSSSVAAYYTVGAGSIGIGSEPAWVGETYDPGAAGFDGGGGAGGYDAGGGGYDGGAFGGFDAGGFGGGFDGGGGFGG